MDGPGCLVFAHAGGGSPEALNHEQALLWSTEEEAVDRITEIGGSIDALRSRLRTHAAQFSTESFVRQFRAVVSGVR